MLQLVLTVKTFTSLLLRTSSTRPSGLPLGIGMVPTMVQEELSKVCLTAPTNDWLKSSILPISSITNTFLLSPSAALTCRYDVRSTEEQHTYTYMFDINTVNAIYYLLFTYCLNTEADWFV